MQSCCPIPDFLTKHPQPLNFQIVAISQWIELGCWDWTQCLQIFKLFSESQLFCSIWYNRRLVLTYICNPGKIFSSFETFFNQSFSITILCLFAYFCNQMSLLWWILKQSTFVQLQLEIFLAIFKDMVQKRTDIDKVISFVWNLHQSWERWMKRRRVWTGQKPEGLMTCAFK